MTKSLQRLDAVKSAKTDWTTQISNVTLKPGRPVDFKEMAAAIDKAGFTAGTIAIRAKGFLEVSPSGGKTLKVSGSNQVFSLVENEDLKKLVPGKEVTLQAQVDFASSPVRLIVGTSEKKETMKGM